MTMFAKITKSLRQIVIGTGFLLIITGFIVGGVGFLDFLKSNFGEISVVYLFLTICVAFLSYHIGGAVEAVYKNRKMNKASCKKNS